MEGKDPDEPPPGCHEDPSTEDPMAQLFLPAAHTEADLVLAGLIAEAVDSAELYVTWTPEEGSAAPAVAAELRLAARRGGRFALLRGALRELWNALLHRDPRTADVAVDSLGPVAAPRQAAG